MSRPDPISAICNVAMRLYADLAHSAGQGSPFALAAERLGAEQSARVASDALRVALKRLLSDDAEAVIAELGSVPGLGEVAAQSRILGVAHEAIEAVIEAGAHA